MSKNPFVRFQILWCTAWLFTGGCTTTIPTWDGKLYAGDSAHAGIARAQSNELILATDPRFDDFVAMTYEDFRLFYKTYVLGCKEWESSAVPQVGTITFTNALEAQLSRSE